MKFTLALALAVTAVSAGVIAPDPVYEATSEVAAPVTTSEAVYDEPTSKVEVPEVSVPVEGPEYGMFILINPNSERETSKSRA